jgi:hypothetical protein
MPPASICTSPWASSPLLMLLKFFSLRAAQNIAEDAQARPRPYPAHCPT